MKDAAGRVIYVGKAKNLRARAGSYFLKAAAEDRRTADLVREIRDIDFLEAESEVDALLIEARLIKDIQPKFNRTSRTTRRFPTWKSSPARIFPASSSRASRSERGTKLYGPFASAGSLRGAIQVLQKIFKFRTCSLDIDEDDEKWRWFRPCLLALDRPVYGAVQPADLEGGVPQDIHRLQHVPGREQEDAARRRCGQEMAAAAAELQFEKAARLRDEIHMLETLDDRGELETHVQPEVFSIDPEEGAGRACKKVLQLDEAAADDRRGRHRPPGRRRNRGQPGAVHRRAAVQAGLPAVQDSRRRRASTTSPASTKWSRGGSSGCEDEGEVFPDILLIDGGKGQLNAALAALRRSGHHAADGDFAGQARRGDLLHGTATSRCG